MAPREVAISSKLRFIQLKYLHMAYRTPIVIHRAHPSYPPGCPKCPCPRADFLHITWTCPRLQHFWGRVEQTVSRVLGRDIILTPKTALLEITFEWGGSRGERRFLGMATMIAKRDIAKHWMAKQSPRLSTWRSGMDWVSKLEEPIYNARGCPQKHHRIWGKWWAFYGLE